MNAIVERIKVKDDTLQITDKALVETDTAKFLNDYTDLMKSDVIKDETEYKAVKVAYKAINDYKSEIDSDVKKKINDFTATINSDWSSVTEPLKKVIDFFYSKKDKYESENCIGKYKRRANTEAKVEAIQTAEKVVQIVNPNTIEIKFECSSEKQKQQLVAFANIIGAKVSL